MNYVALARTAAALIRRAGKTLSILRRSSGAYDAATGTATVTQSTAAAWGARLDYPTREVDGTQVIAGDTKLLLSPVLTLVPQPGDVIVDGAERFGVIAVKTVSPAGTPVLYVVQGRAGG